jgi:hypothetical protein
MKKTGIAEMPYLRPVSGYTPTDHGSNATIRNAI